MATTLGSVAEGSTVYLNESGSRVAFYVAKHDYESALNGAGRTLLVRKECPAKKAWNTTVSSKYAESAIDQWLNVTWFPTLDEIVRNAAGKTKFRYTVGGGSSILTTLSRAAFLLSMTELGMTSTAYNVEGSALPNAEVLQKATYASASVDQWSRTPRIISNVNYAYYITYSSLGSNNTPSQASGTPTNANRGVRPCITLPANMGVDDSNNVTEPVAEILHGSMINNVLCVTKKCYAMIDGVLCAVPYGLANVDGVMTKIQFEEPEPPAPPAQMYTVTITTTPTQDHDAAFAYFQINGTKYDGSKAATLSVQEGTTWTAYVSNHSQSSAGIYIDGKKKNNNQVTGTVTSNMDVKAYCAADPNSYAIYPNVVIKTNQ